MSTESNSQPEAPVEAKRRRKKRTHCKRGHEFTPENTYLTPKGSRICRKCQALRVKESRKKHREAWNAYRRQRRKEISERKKHRE